MKKNEAPLTDIIQITEHENLLASLVAVQNSIIEKLLEIDRINCQLDALRQEELQIENRISELCQSMTK